jgi:hypothetical protein
VRGLGSPSLVTGPMEFPVAVIRSGKADSLAHSVSRACLASYQAGG